MKELVEIDPGTCETLRVFLDLPLVWNSSGSIAIVDTMRFLSTIGMLGCRIDVNCLPSYPSLYR
jgi:hypothetical protein